MAGRKKAQPAAGGSPLAEVNLDGVGTHADVDLAASLPRTSRALSTDIVLTIVTLLLDGDVQAALRTFAPKIEEEDNIDVDAALTIANGFPAIWDAYARLLISVARLHERLVRDNASLASFLTAVSKAYKQAGARAPIRDQKNEHAQQIAKLVKNRDAQRGIAKISAALRALNKKKKSASPSAK